MPEKKKSYLALDKALFFAGDTIVHKNLGYMAVIEKVYNRGAGLITVPDTPENRLIWQKKLPFTFKAQNIIKTFKHQTTNPKLDLL